MEKMRITFKKNNQLATARVLAIIANGIINIITGPLMIAVGLVLLPICFVADIIDAYKGKKH